MFRGDNTKKPKKAQIWDFQGNSRHLLKPSLPKPGQFDFAHFAWLIFTLFNLSYVEFVNFSVSTR